MRSFDDQLQSLRQFRCPLCIHPLTTGFPLALRNRLEHLLLAVSATASLFLHRHTTALRNWPRHSRQRRFSRDVISPQFGHILCRDPGTSGFLSRIQRSSRIVNSTISRPRERRLCSSKKTVLGKSRVYRAATFRCPTVGLLPILSAVLKQASDL